MAKIYKIVGIIALVLMGLTIGACGNETASSEWTEGATLPKEPPKLTVVEKEKPQVAVWDAEYVNKSADGRTFDMVGLQLDINGGSVRRVEDTIYISLDTIREGFANIQISDESEKLEISAPTFFYDDNGLLCINVKCVFPKESDNDVFQVVKSYYWSGEYVFNLVSNVQGHMVESSKTVYVPMSAVMQSFQFDYRVNQEDDAVQISGGKISSERVVSKLYEYIPLKPVGGHIWTAEGIYATIEGTLGEEYLDNFTAIPLENAIPVTGLEELRATVYSSWLESVGTIVFLDENDRPVNVVSTDHSTTYNSFDFVVPGSATKMVMTCFSGQKYELYRPVEYVGVNLKTLDRESYYEGMYQSMEKTKAKSIKEAMPKYHFDKGYISFVLDDMRPDVDQVVNIFEEYNIPVCLAVPGRLTNTTIRGEKSLYEVCEQVIANGGEILAHNSDVVTEENVEDIEAMFEIFCRRKFDLESYGYDVNGIILSGGTGQIKSDARTDLYARANYLYSDLYGEEQYAEPYYHPRTLVTHLLDKYKSEFDGCVENKDWRVIYFHGLNEITEEQLREMLRTVQNYRKRGLEVVTYSQAYEMAHEE